MFDNLGLGPNHLLNALPAQVQERLLPHLKPVPLALGDDLDAWDGWLAARLTAADLATKPFTPLPVLGVPGWWPANQDPVYYDDATVFRPRRVPA